MFRNYLTLAWKVLQRRKFFSFASLFAIAFTLTVLIVAAAIVDHTFGRRAPENHLDRTLVVAAMELSGKEWVNRGAPGYALLERTVRGLPQTEEVSLVGRAARVPTYLEGTKVSPWVKRTDGAFWRIHDFTFLEGGPFSDDDETQGRFVAVINAATRQRFFGAEPALGKTLPLGRQTFRVVGVVEDVSFLRPLPFADVWVPISTHPFPSFRQDWIGEFNALILARDRAAFPAIQDEFAARLAKVPLPDPEHYDHFLGRAETYFSAAAQEALPWGRGNPSAGRELTLLLAAAAVLFMLLPAVNLININLSRILERAGEIGVRKAFGAPVRVLAGQFVIENLVITVFGGVLGLGLSALLLAALNASGWIPHARMTLNPTVFAAGFGFALFFGLLSGAYPAWRLARLHPVSALRGRSL